jgi:hypothetical protein
MSPKSASTVSLARAACVFLQLLSLSARAQNIELPVPEVSLVPASRTAVLTWNEIPTSAGRAVTGFTISGFDSLSPAVVLSGTYQADCDYLLRVTKEPTGGFDQLPTPTLPGGRDVRVVLKYQLWTNTSNIGAPLVEDFVDLRQPNVAVPIIPQVVGALGLSISAGPNIDAPSGPLGTIPVTITGLNTGASPIRNYMVTAESNGSLSPGGGDSIAVRVTGPFDTLPPGVTAFDSLMTVHVANAPIKIMNGMYITFGFGATAPGDTTLWTARHVFPLGSKVEANLEAFEGYHVWRSDLPDVDGGFTLLGEIRQCESKFDFELIDPEEAEELSIVLAYDPQARSFEIVDRDIHDDFPYRYAVSTFDIGFLGNRQSLVFEGALAETQRIYPAIQVRDPRREAYVVPNPYKRSADWEEGEAKIVFANLPPSCSIRIFSEAADHVATLQHGPGQTISTSPTSATWDLVSDAGQDVAPGIYMFFIESSDGFQQIGKVIVAR